MEYKDTKEYKEYAARQKQKKLTPEEIVEQICRLDSVDLVRIGDEAQRKGMAGKLINVIEAAAMEASIPRMLDKNSRGVR